MTTKQELDRHSEHDLGHKSGPQYNNPNGQSGADLSRQISVQLTSQQFEGEGEGKGRAEARPMRVPY